MVRKFSQQQDVGVFHSPPHSKRTARPSSTSAKGHSYPVCNALRSLRAKRKTTSLRMSFSGGDKRDTPSGRAPRLRRSVAHRMPRCGGARPAVSPAKRKQPPLGDCFFLVEISGVSRMGLSLSRKISISAHDLSLQTKESQR